MSPGPILSSGVCTEVFQFDTSSTNEGAPKPATVTNRSATETGRVPAKKGLPSRRDPFAVGDTSGNSNGGLSRNGKNGTNGGNGGNGKYGENGRNGENGRDGGNGGNGRNDGNGRNRGDGRNEGVGSGDNVGGSKEGRVMAGGVGGAGGVGELGMRDESMVVSVLASPGGGRGKERGGGGGGGGVTQVFVVVLVNGVRYVTYACKLPLIGGGGASVVAS